MDRHAEIPVFLTLICPASQPWPLGVSPVNVFACCLFSSLRARPLPSHVVVTKLCLTLARLLCPFPRISQARRLEWVAISFSRRSSQPRDQTHISCIGRWILYLGTSREAWEQVNCFELRKACFFLRFWFGMGALSHISAVSRKIFVNSW